MITKVQYLSGLGKYHNKIKDSLASAYYLPTASESVKGGVKIGQGFQMIGDTLNVTLQGASTEEVILLTDKLETCEGDIDVLNADIFTLQNKVLELDGDMVLFGDSVSAFDSKVDSLAASIDSVNENFLSHNDEVEIFFDEVDTLKKSFDALDEDFSALGASVADSISGFATELEVYTSGLESTSIKADANAEKISELDNEVYLHGEKIDELETDVASLQSRMDSLPAANSDIVLDTVASTVDGAIWYEFVNNAPVLKLRSGNYEYAFAYDSMKYAGSNTGLVSYLPFENSATEDVCGNVWTATGNASLDSSVKKFGAASAHFPSGAYISATDVLHLSAEKWTFDAWMYLVSTSGAHGYFGLGATNTTTGIEVLASNVYIADNSGSNWATQVSTATLGWDATNTWMHVAIVKDGSSLMFFKDGVKKYTYTLQTDIYDTGAFSIGTSTVARTGNDLYFDSVRFFEGVALWTDDFTPPTASDYD